MKNYFKIKCENFVKIHPLFSDHKYDQYNFPILKKENFKDAEFDEINATNLKNIKNCPNKQKSIVLMFNNDNVLNSLWNNPFNPLIYFQGFFAICTPDFSIYDGMNENIIKYNVFRNRWYGCFLQEKGFRVIPTIQWCERNTYDICFSGIPKNSVVAISTLGCKKYKEKFIEGFNEMYKRIEPNIIICFGGIIEGMHGKILAFKYEDSFNKAGIKTEQLKLFKMSQIIDIGKEVSYYGK